MGLRDSQQFGPHRMPFPFASKENKITTRKTHSLLQLKDLGNHYDQRHRPTIDRQKHARRWDI